MLRVISAAPPASALSRFARTRCRYFTKLHNSCDLNRRKSMAAAVASYPDSDIDDSAGPREEIQRLKHIRNVGVLAHVDAGKTTVTERMLALSGVVHRAGSVDDGDTVTDYLPAERERGITIQSAAISFDWHWHNNRSGDDYEANDSVQIQLIDTPGHVDFSVEVNRSVAVLDGAVLVVDAVAGVQAQTETVWRAITRPSLNNHDEEYHGKSSYQDHAHEPLPCVAVINKMDKDGCHFNNAVDSLRYKLPGANPVPLQLPLFRVESKNLSSSLGLHGQNFVAAPIDGSNESLETGDFVGVVDILHMRAVVWPEVADINDIDNCAPTIIPLVDRATGEAIDADCTVTQHALAARHEIFEAMAELDEEIEECYLAETEPTNAELRRALRRATLSRKAMPVMASAALRGKGVEPVMDAIADLLPSPLDRLPPALTKIDDGTTQSGFNPSKITLGHPLHPSLLALAFKVVHMKGRGGSGDGRVVFARIYSGKIKDRDVIHAISPQIAGELPEEPRVERVGGMLELAGGRFGKLSDGICNSGDVVALVGMKSVVTGDTIVLAPSKQAKKSKKGKKKSERVCLAGVASPKPVLTVRLEPETTEQQSQLSEALRLLLVEDPSLSVEESGSSTLLSGLGELHIEVVLDRLYREFGLQVRRGAPSVNYRQTITDAMETPGATLLNYDRTVGGTRLQASVHLRLEPCTRGQFMDSGCMLLSEPNVSVGPAVFEFLGLDENVSDDDAIQSCAVYKSLIQGCQGALKRGPLGSGAMANINCHIVNIDAEDGFAGLEAFPGSLRAAAANAVSVTLSENEGSCRVLEPVMGVEITLPPEMVGGVLSDLTSRRGTIGDVIIGEDDGATQHSKALIRGDVPLGEIIGYANSLRSLTGGEGSFTAEYKGHSPCTDVL